MQKLKRVFALVGLIALDVLSIVASMLLSFRINFPAWDTWIPGTYNSDYILTFVIVASLAMIALNIICGNYSSSLKHFGFGEIIRSCVACLIFFVGFWLALIFWNYIYRPSLLF